MSNCFLIYIAAVIAIPIICSYAIILKNKPKDYEVFSFFSDIEISNDDAFNNVFKETLPEDLEFNIFSCNRTDKNFTTFVSAYGLTSDLVMLSKTTLDSLTQWDFLVLDDVNKWDLPTNYKFYDKSVAVLAHVKNSEKLSRFFDFSNLDDDYYFAVGKNSVHTKLFTGVGKTDQVDRILEKLTSL